MSVRGTQTSFRPTSGALGRTLFTGLKSALSGGSLLFGAVMLVNVLNYGYALFLGRFLGPEAYGAYASFMSLFLIISLLPLTLQQVTAKYAAAGESVLTYGFSLALSWGGLFGLGLALSSPFLGPTVKLPPLWLLLLGLSLPLYALLGALRGEAQGQQRLGRLGGNMVLEHLGKIALTPLVFLGWPTASGAVVATLGALPLTFAGLGRFLGRQAISPLKRAEVRRYALPVFLGLAAQALIIHSDVLLANALLKPEEAGLYAATSLVGRVVFYGSWAVALALFPYVAAQGAAGKPHLRLLYLGLALTGTLCLGAVLICAFFPEWVVGLLFGRAYLAAAPLVAPYAFVTSLYALANVLSNHHLALGHARAGYVPLLAAALQILLILLHHTGPLQMIWVQAAAKGGLFLALALLAYMGLLKGGQRVLR